MQQRKISEWLNALPEPYRSEALENFRAQKQENLIKTDAISAVFYAFIWFKTPQKGKYWNRLCLALRRGEIPLQEPSAPPAPVNTWIPVEELGNYTEIEEAENYQNTIGWFETQWAVVDYDNDRKLYYNECTIKLPTHIMIINPPNQ